MPALENPRHEGFAQARVRGVLLIDAYDSAGLVRHRGHCSRLVLTDELTDLIAELRPLQTDMDDVSPKGLLASLAPSRPQAMLAERLTHEHRHLDKVFSDMAAETAAVTASKPAPEPVAQRPSPPPQAPAAAPSAPRQRPSIAQGAPAHLPASAAMSPLKLPGLSPAPCGGMAARNWR